MENLDSDFSKACTVCGQVLPVEGCEVEQCEHASAAPLWGACGQPQESCGEPDCPSILAHEAKPHFCSVCEREVSPGETCERTDCPRLAVEAIRRASIDTPFKLGL